MGDFFSELFKALRYFITRDVMYLVGGGSVCVTLLYVSGQPLTKEYPTGIWLLAAGVAYGVGYAVQEILSLFPCLTTAPVLKPNRLVRWLYRRFTLTNWSCIDRSAWPKKMQTFEENAPSRTFAQFQRIIGLKHIGSTLGANWLVSGCVLGIYAASNQGSKLDFVLVFGTLFLATGLIAMAWVKGAQQTQYVWNWVK